jgi:hypothetical protein
MGLSRLAKLSWTGLSPLIRVALIAISVLALVACATPPPADYDLIVTTPLDPPAPLFVAGRDLAAPAEVWVMAIQLCRGPPEYGAAIRRGVPLGTLMCNWFFYTGMAPNHPREFRSKTECDDFVIPETNEGFHWGRRKCGRLE